MQLAVIHFHLKFMNKLFLPAFLLVSLFLLPEKSTAQSIKGQTIDQSTMEPIPYVNVGVLHQQMGTVSDENGDFSLLLTGVNPEDTLKISSIGYEPLVFSVAEAMAFTEKKAFSLSPKEVLLDEVVIVPKDYKLRTVGNDNTPDFMRAGFRENKLGYEMGVKMKSRKPAFIEEIYIEIAECTYDTIFYRLNIYEMVDGLPGRNILRKPIYLTYTQDEVQELLTVNIKDQYVRVDGPFIVSLELVKELGEGNLMLKTGVMNNKTWLRETSQAEWSSIPFGVGISALINEER